MEQTNTKTQLRENKQQLLLLCRFLAVSACCRIMLVLLACTGFLLTLLHKTQFAPYGIALICLLLPSFLNNSASPKTKKENSDRPLSVLFRRYHYSLSAFTGYRITLLVCMLLLLIWHKIQTPPLTLLGASLPLLYLALCLALSTILGRILFFLFHHRLMNGTL